MSEPRWLTKAKSYIGLHEGTSLKANPKVLKFFQEAGHPEIKNDHTTPWCAAFVGAVLAECGIKGTGTLWALDYAKWGQKLKTPVVGAIGTKKRKTSTGVAGHTFFVAAFNKTHVTALGGNQDDQVCMELIPINEINSYSWPPGEPIPANTVSGKVQGKTGISET